jgi:hypothetical protein
MPMSGSIKVGVELLPPGQARAAPSSYSFFVALRTPIVA